MRRGFDGVRTVSGESDDHPLDCYSWSCRRIELWAEDRRPLFLFRQATLSWISEVLKFL